MELLEAATSAKTWDEIKIACPLSVEVEALTYEDDSLELDDVDLEPGTLVPKTSDPRAGMPSFKYKVQENNGGTLGRNLESGSVGSKNTFLQKITHIVNGDKTTISTTEGMYFSAYKVELPRKDTSVDDTERVTIAGDPFEYPYTVAAHHLIPGNEALKASVLWRYVNKSGDSRKVVKYVGKKKVESSVPVPPVEVEGQGTFEIKENIGYNVNGAHNGVWLPGNYAMSKENHPPETTPWMEQMDIWRLEYIRQLARRTKGQFHDRHASYSRAIVDNLLNPIAQALDNHILNCEECREKSQRKLPPPYPLIESLFKGSKWLRGQVSGDPNVWLKPYFTSDSWQEPSEFAQVMKVFRTR